MCWVLLLTEPYDECVERQSCLLYGVRKQKEGTGRSGGAVTHVVTVGKVPFQSEQGTVDSFGMMIDGLVFGP